MLTDLLPAEVSFVSADQSQGGCGDNLQTVTCNLGNVDGLQTVTVIIDVTVDVGAPSGQITNTAHVTGDQSDPALANANDTAVTTVAGAPPCRG